MKTILLLTLLFSFHFSMAEISDVEVTCHNLKGEVLHNTYFRIEKDSVKVFETTGGFAFYGQFIMVKTEPTGILRMIQVPCGADLVSPGDVSLITCAPGSQVRFLNKVLPPSRSGCR